MASGSAAVVPVPSGPEQMNWEPIRQRLLGSDLKDALVAAQQLRDEHHATVVHSSSFALYLSALLPALSSLLMHRTHPQSKGVERELRQVLLDLIAKFPHNETLRPHANHLVALSVDVLSRDDEENALVASRLMFALYKAYRSLTQDYVQPYLDFVAKVYRTLPQIPLWTMERLQQADTNRDPSSSSLRVLTECPLVVMLLFQLYPRFLKTNIPVLINVMMDVLALRAPAWQALSSDNPQLTSSTNVKRAYASQVRELVAAQAKTLSFLTYLLRSFSNELKPHQDKLATHVVSLMSVCPREAFSTRKELLVATRHLLHSDFRHGFLKHVDSLLDERVLLGSSHSRSLLRPMAFTTLSDLVQHVRNKLTMPQMSKVVAIFGRVLHDASVPLVTKYASVRTLLSVAELIYHNKDPNPQLGRDLLVRILSSLTETLEGLPLYAETLEKEPSRLDALQHGGNESDSLRDIQSMVRAIIAGHKAIIYYTHTYRMKRDPAQRVSGNEEVHSAMLKLTNTEAAIVDRYILAALPAARLLRDSPEHHREALTYFGAAFTALDGYNLRRTLGRRLDFLVDNISADPMVMIVPRHLLAANPATSLEFCSIMMDFLMERIDELSMRTDDGMLFLDQPFDDCGPVFMAQYRRSLRRPSPSDEMRTSRSSTLLQLFERLLKTLATYPENEPIVRRHLRSLVSTCLRSAMENALGWPDNYCMLLRYIFRSISAGKFEDSYKELLPLIPSVLNGLYRVVITSDDFALKNTAIELCLTIPARLSSFLPYMNLLLQIIVASLNSGVAELVNLGLRTLEFWIDNLNPEFLYPEMTRNVDLFARLMQSLSLHLRPAPYTYGLLTLRLLGKLGGKNRLFLREPLDMPSIDHIDMTNLLLLRCRWSPIRLIDGSIPAAEEVYLPIPLDRCLALLRAISATTPSPSLRKRRTVNAESSILWHEKKRLWDDSAEDLDLVSYSADVALTTVSSQREACVVVVQTALELFVSSRMNGSVTPRIEFSAPNIRRLGSSLLHAWSHELDDERIEKSVDSFIRNADDSSLAEVLAEFVGTSAAADEVVQRALHLVDNEGHSLRASKLSSLFLVALCENASREEWGSRARYLHMLLALVKRQGNHWARENEIRLINTAFLAVKGVPRELSNPSMSAFRFFLDMCNILYGPSNHDSLQWDVLATNYSESEQCSRATMPIDSAERLDEASKRNVSVQADASSSAGESGVETNQSTTDTKEGAKEDSSAFRPSDDVLRLCLQELSSNQQLARVAARYLFSEFICPVVDHKDVKDKLADNMRLIRRGLFSRTLRLLPLPNQVGVVEGLALLVERVPSLLPLSDQSILSCLSEMLKMASVADGEMSDSTLTTCVVDRNGFAVPAREDREERLASVSPDHSHALFFRRECILCAENGSFVVPGEESAGVQLRISIIFLLHFVIKRHAKEFLQSDTSGAIGNIRPHVISLLFRSLVSQPAKAVEAASLALRDVLTFGFHHNEGEDSGKLPKKLLQTCIRPVLSDLKDYSKLSRPLLRGLSQLLSLLSSWFNKTLGEKLMDHLQQWTDPSRILAVKKWKDGEEIEVATAVVATFALLPLASQFVEPLVKTIMRLEVALPVYKYRCVVSPFRKPLARFLNLHAQQSVNFFFQRLKSPIYSELFQSVLVLDECKELRAYLCNNQCSLMILNGCFEKPLAIIRSEKRSSSSSSAKALSIHGIASPQSPKGENPTVPPGSMTTEALELQHQGFLLIRTLLAGDGKYFAEHNDIVRALRWLWRSRGRFLRLQHEDLVAPRFHSESKLLAHFLMNYAQASPSDDIDVLFELIRVFLPQSSAHDFGSLGRFLSNLVSSVLSRNQKQQVLGRFFSLLVENSNEELKVLSVQYLIFPLLLGAADATDHKDVDDALVTDDMVKKFVKDVLFVGDTPAVCGDRLRIELLRLSFLIVELREAAAEEYRKEIVKYCWALLKTEDSMCKSWAYVVVSRIVSSFETPAKIVSQVFVSLLRAHQPEGRDLVRLALKLLVPALPSRLTENELKQTIEQACQVLVEEGNSSLPILAHVISSILDHPQLFEDHHSRIVGYMVSSLARLGLATNSPHQHRQTALEMIKFILKRDDPDGEDLSVVHAEAIATFLSRLRLVVGEPVDSRSGKMDPGLRTLETETMQLLRTVVGKWKVNVNLSHIEKAVCKRDKPVPSVTIAALEILACFAEADITVMESGSEVVRDVVTIALENSKDDETMQARLMTFTIAAASIPEASDCMALIFENALIGGTVELKKAASSRAGDGTRLGGRTREKTQAVDESSARVAQICFIVSLVNVLCQRREAMLARMSNPLLSLAATLTKIHLAGAHSKQRHGVSQETTTTGSPGVLHWNPTAGVLDSLLLQSRVDISRVASAARSRALHDVPKTSACDRALVVILGMFELSDVTDSFSMGRKTLLHVVSSLMESSDSVRVIVQVARMTGKWVLEDRPRSPLTIKERSSFLTKLSLHDFNCVSDDAAAQPVADVVTMLISELSGRVGSMSDTDRVAFRRLIISCMLHPSSDERRRLICMFNESFHESQSCVAPLHFLWRMLHSDFEGLGGRLWLPMLVEGLTRSLQTQVPTDFIDSMVTLSQSDPSICAVMFEQLFRALWSELTDGCRIRVAQAIEYNLSRPYHAQFVRTSPASSVNQKHSNMPRSWLRAVLQLQPCPTIDCHILTAVAENYNAWFEVIDILQRQHQGLSFGNRRLETLSALRYCYRMLGESAIWNSVTRDTCQSPMTVHAMVLDLYGAIDEASESYATLMEAAGSGSSSPSDEEMDVWEGRWLDLQKELCQLQVVSEFADASGDLSLQLECAWKSQDWAKVRNLTSSTGLLASIENGSPEIKICETLLAVVDGKKNDMDNLHAQAAQLCLHRWQLLPQLSDCSHSHSQLFGFFHRLVEIRESGQIMEETSKHSSRKTLPELKNLLNAWRHRLPNDFESLSSWDELFSWRSHMYSAITSNFHYAEPNMLATLHDRPWTTVRLAKTARIHGKRDVALFLLNRVSEEKAMNVSDAYLKLREQVLAYDSPGSEVERYGGVNLINTTNMSFFDSAQKAELLRLKGTFLVSIGGTKEANQSYCNALQICPTHGSAWESWGKLCCQIGLAAEKQTDKETPDDGSKESSSSQKSTQYFAQAMGCYIEAILLGSSRKTRVNVPKLLWMLSKDSSSTGVLCTTFRSRATQLPAWVWLPWTPQLLTSLCRQEASAIKSVLSTIVKAYPQAVYHPLRAFFLDRRDVERMRSPSTSGQSTPMKSVSLAEELMSTLRRAHPSLWTSLESMLEEFLYKFRLSSEEEMLTTLVALLERAEAQTGIAGKAKEDEIAVSLWKTLGRIATKYFKPTETTSTRRDDRSTRTAAFKENNREAFEEDFGVSSSASESQEDVAIPDVTLDGLVEKMRSWKSRLEVQVMGSFQSTSLIEYSRPLAMFCVNEAPDLWPGACDPVHAPSRTSERRSSVEDDTNSPTSGSGTSSSASAARKAAESAARLVSASAEHEGAGGEYGGGSSFMEIPGLYMPSSGAWTDMRPSPELHAKLLRFEPQVEVLRRGEQLVRRIGMVGSDGQVYRFFLQYSLPYWTRSDERTSQMFFVLDKLLANDVRASRAHLSVQPHAVIPVAQRLRLVREPKSRVSLEEVYDKSLPRDADNQEFARRFNVSLRKRISQRLREAGDEPNVGVIEDEARIEVYRETAMAAKVPSRLLVDHMEKRLSSPEALFQFRRTFSNQWAASCLLQYVFATPDRNPGRVVIMEDSGRVISPDCRTSYNNHGVLETYRLPFRLSNNLASLIGFPLVDATFGPAMAMISSAVADAKEDMFPVLCLLMRDDLLAYSTKTVAKSDSKTQESERQMTDFVLKNVATIQSRFDECKPVLKVASAPGPLPDAKVRNLIEEAQKEENLSSMLGQFQGWV